MIVRVKGESERLGGVLLVGTHAIHTRIVRDPGGAAWQVTESLASHVPGAVAATCLIFDSGSICRRYWSYPADWLTRTDQQLLALMVQSRQLVR